MTSCGNLSRRIVLLVAGSIIGLAGLFATAIAGGFRLNLTPSEPIGLWRIEEPDRAIATGDLVFVCPPQIPAIEEARRRRYLARGLCPGGLAPLLKMVAALPGQRVEIGDHVVIDGQALLLSSLRRIDGAGRPLQPFVGGAVPPGTLFLHSHFKSSYDSRYFGPVPASGLLGLARPILTFDP